MFEKNIELAKNWLLNSGIQNIEDIKDLKGINLKGSFNSWFDLDKNIYPYAYSEITGYAITTLSFLYYLEKKPEFLHRAQLAADWLKSIKKQDLYPSIFSLNQHNFQHKESLIYIFDIGMILNGLTNLYKITEQKKYFEEAQKIAFWILNLQKSDGSLPAVYDLEKNKIADTKETWSTHSGSYHAKISIGLINLYDITKKEDYKDAIIKLCNYALTQQKSDGRFISHIKGGTNLHPHCYSAEGLLCTGIYLKNKKYIDSARKATEWILNNEKNNIIPRLYLNDFNYNQRNDALAQTLRLSLVLSKMGYLEHHKEKISNLLNKLIESQHQNGGFFFGLSSDGNKLNHLNSWTTMFALQTLILNNKTIKENEIAQFLI